MEDLVNKIFSDEPKKRKRAIIKYPKKTEKDENLPILILSGVEESESENKNEYSNEFHKQMKKINKISSKNLMVVNEFDLNNNSNNNNNICESPSPKHKKFKKYVSLNKTSLVTKKKKKQLNDTIDDNKIDLNNNPIDKNSIFSNEKNICDEDSVNKNSPKKKRIHAQCSLNSNNIELRSKFKNSKHVTSSNKTEKNLVNNNNPKESKKNVKPVFEEPPKNKIRFAIKEEENLNESIDNNDDKENSIISFEFNKSKKHKTNKFLSLKSDGNIDNNLNNNGSYNNEDNSGKSKESKESDNTNNVSITKKRKPKKTCTIKPRKTMDPSGKKEKKIKYKDMMNTNDDKITNDKENIEITDFNDHVEKSAKQPIPKKQTKISSNHGTNLGPFQFGRSCFNTIIGGDGFKKNVKKLSNEVLKPKNSIIDEIDKSSYKDDDSKSNESKESKKSKKSKSEEEIKASPRITRKEGKNRKTMKVERCFKSSKKLRAKFVKYKIPDESIFQIENQVKDMYIENKHKKFNTSEFEIVKLENLVSIEYTNKPFLQTNNVQQNFNKVPLRNFDGDGSNNITNNNITNNITIYRKESHRKKSENDDNLMEDNKVCNNENINENKTENKDVDLEIKKNMKNDKKSSVFCCL